MLLTECSRGIRNFSRAEGDSATLVPIQDLDLKYQHLCMLSSPSIRETEILKNKVLIHRRLIEK